MITAKEFWDWFVKNNAKFFFLNQIDDEDEKEKIMDEFLKKIHEYSEKLYFQIGGHPNEVQDLIITAEGNIDYFDKVEELVRSAPQLKDWNIIAFKPPADSNFVVDLNGAKIDPRKTWFMPLENKKRPELFGVRLFIDDYSDSTKKDFLNVAYLALDSLLGEKANAINIQHLEVTKLIGDPIEKGLLSLTQLPSYIKKRKLASNLSR
jgi:hypothetical protein